MNTFTRADGAFALLCIVVMVAIFTVIALVLFVRKLWSNASEKHVQLGDPDKISRRLASITKK